MSRDAPSVKTARPVIQPLPNAQFKVRLPDGHELLAYLGGKLRRNPIRVLLGDVVKVERSPYDLTRGRITHRVRWPEASLRPIEAVQRPVLSSTPMR